MRHSIIQYCYYYKNQTKLFYDLHFISLHRQCNRAVCQKLRQALFYNKFVIRCMTDY